jgi:hypothetical protein
VAFDEGSANDEMAPGAEELREGRPPDDTICGRRGGGRSRSSRKNMKRSLPILSVGMAALLACGTDSMPRSTTGSCTVTVGGAVSHTSACSVSVVSPSATGVITFGLTDQAAVFVDLALGTMALHVGTYDPATAKGTLGYRSGDQAWLAASGSDHDQGAFTLTFSSIGTFVVSSPGNAYVGAHGVLDATLPAVTGSPASGSVTLHATF